MLYDLPVADCGLGMLSVFTRSTFLKLSHIGAENSAFSIIHGIEQQQIAVVAPDGVWIESCVDSFTCSFGQGINPCKCAFGVFFQVNQAQRYFSIFGDEILKAVTIGDSPAFVAVE
jgi:hypothetical protein